MRIVDDLRGKKLYDFDQNPTPISYSKYKQPPNKVAVPSFFLVARQGNSLPRWNRGSPDLPDESGRSNQLNLN